MCLCDRDLVEEIATRSAELYLTLLTVHDGVDLHAILAGRGIVALSRGVDFHYTDFRINYLRMRQRIVPRLFRRLRLFKICLCLLASGFLCLFIVLEDLWEGVLLHDGRGCRDVLLMTLASDGDPCPLFLINHVLDLVIDRLRVRVRFRV